MICGQLCGVGSEEGIEGPFGRCFFRFGEGGCERVDEMGRMGEFRFVSMEDVQLFFLSAVTIVSEGQSGAS